MVVRPTANTTRPVTGAQLSLRSRGDASIGRVEQDGRDEEGQCELGQDGERRRAWNEREGRAAEREKHRIGRAHASRDGRQDGGGENKTNQDFEFCHVPKRAEMARLVRAVEHTANPIAPGCFGDVLALAVAIGQLRSPLEQQLQDGNLLPTCLLRTSASASRAVEPQDAAASSRPHSAAGDRRRRPAAPVTAARERVRTARCRGATPERSTACGSAPIDAEVLDRGCLGCRIRVIAI